MTLHSGNAPALRGVASISPVLRVLLFGLFAILGCGSDDDSSASPAGMDDDRLLAELEPAEFTRMCKAIERRLSPKDASAVQRGGCVTEALLSLDWPRPEGDTVCEQTVEECLDNAQAPDLLRCDTPPESRCKATVTEYDDCMMTGFDQVRSLGELDCDSIDPASVQAITRSNAADACEKKLDGCFDYWPPDAGSGNSAGDEGEVDAADQTSNADWVDAIEALVAAQDRPDCEEAFARDAQLDQLATKLAQTPNSPTLVLMDLKVSAIWKRASAPKLDPVLVIHGKFIAENAPICTWRNFGIGIDGDPGSERTTILLLSE